MLDVVDYASLLQYSPRGSSEIAVKSRKVKNNIKAGRIEVFRKRIAEIINDNSAKLSPFLGEEITLVPAPRSSPIKPDALWPAMEVCKLFGFIKLRDNCPLFGTPHGN